MLEKPALAILSSEILSAHDGPRAPTDPVVGTRAATIMQLMHFVALGDLESAGAVLSDDVVFEIPASHVEFPVRRAVGRDAVLDAFRQNFAVVHSQEHALQHLVEDGQTCIMVMKERGKTASGESYEGFGTFVFGFRGDAIRLIVEITAAASR